VFDVRCCVVTKNYQFYVKNQKDNTNTAVVFSPQLSPIDNSRCEDRASSIFDFY